jgi:hypothetical protein
MKKILICLIACMFIISMLPGIFGESDTVENTLKERRYKEDRKIVPILTEHGLVRAPTGKGKPIITVDITDPADGSTVSGVVDIIIDSNANPNIIIDGINVGKGLYYQWDTTGYSNGLHTITASARGVSDTHTVTVNNGGGNTPPVVTITYPNDGATVSGIVTITVDATDAEDPSITPDIYIDGSYKATANSYDWDTTAYLDGSHTIYAEATDSGLLTGSDEITVSVNNGGIVDKYALVIGISDYEGSGNDLTWCDEDADDWEYFLQSQGYQVTKLVDHQATAENIEAALIQLLQNEDGDDYVALTYSGHGYDYPGYGSCIISQDLTYITHGYFESAFDTADSQHIYFTFDACEIGGFGGLVENNRVGVFASNRRFSYDGNQIMQNGVFTYYQMLGWDVENFDNFEDDGNYAVQQFKAWARAYRIKVDPFVKDMYTGPMMP